MAKEKETPPALISYSTEDAEQDTCTGSSVIKYYQKAWAKKRVSVIVTSVKERSLAKRIAQEYGESAYDLIDSYIRSCDTQSKLRQSVKFTTFYMKRHDIAKDLAPKEYGWE